jgi:hypothetical protein
MKITDKYNQIQDTQIVLSLFPSSSPSHCYYFNFNIIIIIIKIFEI